MRMLDIATVLSLLIVAAVGGCLSGGGPQTVKPVATDIKATGGPSEPRVSSEAGITITAAYLGGNAFDLRIDTHSGSLDYEMAKISYIRDSKGNITRPEAWDGGIGGHHLRGTLKFPKFDDSAGFELVFQGVGGAGERVLKW